MKKTLKIQNIKLTSEVGIYPIISSFQVFQGLGTAFFSEIKSTIVG